MNNRGNSKTLIIILVVVLLVIGLYWWSSKQQPTTKSVTGQDELTSISNDLDATDIDGPIDSGLSQNDADAQGF